MFTVGQGLYNLTERDQATLYMDSFFRSSNATIAAASSNAEASITIPVDRCLYLNTYIFEGQASALSQWFAIGIQAKNDAGTSFRVGYFESTALLGDYSSSSAAGSVCTISRSIGIVLPPATKSISCIAFRTGATNPASFNFNVVGYLIPPAGIGRLS